MNSRWLAFACVVMLLGFWAGPTALAGDSGGPSVPVTAAGWQSLWAGPWIDWGGSEITISDAGGHLSADWEFQGQTGLKMHSYLQASTTGSGRTAKGTFLIKNGDQIQENYSIDLTLSKDARSIAMAGKRIEYGVPEFSVTLNRPRSWKSGVADEEEQFLTVAYTLGNDIALPETKPVALRLSIRLADANRSRYSIVGVTPDAINTLPGRYAVGIDNADGFYFYTDGSNESRFLQAPPGAKEVTFDVPYLEFGRNPASALPKTVTVTLRVTLRSEIAGVRERTEWLRIPVRIDHAFTVRVIRCGPSGCPTFKNARLMADAPASGLWGDEIRIPMDARLYVQFLDGSVGYFVNRTDGEWRITLGAGGFKSPQVGGYAENIWDIQAVEAKGTQAGAAKAAEKGLEILLRKATSHSTPGVILSIARFFGARSAGGELIAIRLRSTVGVSLYSSGQTVVRNFQGAPEILQDNLSPLRIPEGYQSAKPKGMRFGPVERFAADDPSATIWDERDESTTERRSGSSRVLDTVASGSLAAWSTVYNPTDFNPRFFFEEVSSGNGSRAIRTRAAGDTLATCETKWIRRIYDTGPVNSDQAVLELTADFAFNGTTYNLPSIAVELLDANGVSLGSKRYFGRGIIGAFNRSKLGETGYVELPTATGVHRIPLREIGQGKTFSKIAISLMNYTCQGENSVVFRRLALDRRAVR